MLRLNAESTLLASDIVLAGSVFKRPASGTWYGRLRARRRSGVCRNGL